MEIIAGSREMKQCDAETIVSYGVPSLVLMERAALGVAEEIRRRQIDSSRTLILCGTGNNGGDGLAVARLLHLAGSYVTALIPPDQEKMTAETAQQYRILEKYHVRMAHSWEQVAEHQFTLVVDAIFGIGLSRDVEGVYRQWIEEANRMPGFHLAIDIPSGINADNGQQMGCSFSADLTVTFAYRKIGHLLYPGSAHSGEVVAKDIGISRESWREREPSCYAYGPEDLALLPRRVAHSNKGTYGRALIIAGKKNMAGASYFSAKAALMAGCGLVKVFTVEENRVILQQLIPEAILETYEAEEAISERFPGRVKELLEWADVAVLGPGLGVDNAAVRIVECVLGHAKIPVILDADGINVCASHKGLLAAHRGPLILTPHLGEMARLMGCTVEQLQHGLMEAAQRAAEEYRAACVLKDARTVTALPGGTRYINVSGNHGMATAGAGDVLTGVIAALIAQGMGWREAAALGVYLHGCGGDFIAAQVGRYGMTASDIIEGVRQVMALAEKNMA